MGFHCVGETKSLGLSQGQLAQNVDVYVRFFNFDANAF